MTNTRLSILRRRTLKQREIILKAYIKEDILIKGIETNHQKVINLLERHKNKLINNGFNGLADKVVTPMINHLNLKGSISAILEDTVLNKPAKISRDKLITVRIQNTMKNDLEQVSSELGVSVSEIVYRAIIAELDSFRGSYESK